MEHDNKTDEIKNNIIKNAFLIAVINKLDLGSIVSFVDRTVNEASDDNKVDDNYAGLLFAKLLAEEMNIPIAELINFDEDYQRKLIDTLISIISMEGIVLEIYKADTINEESYITFVISDLKVFDKTAEFKEIESTDEELPEKNDYLIELVRENKRYSMNILTNNIPQSNFFKGQIEVWNETEGLVADFTDEQLEENESLSFKEGITEEELVACVFNDTRTINLLDKFEGIDDKDAKIYQRLIIKNGMINGKYGDPYLHLVIERRTSNEITGDITFTEFKKGEIAGLREYLSEEISQDDINMYLDMNQFFKFSKGYLLRAQNSKNRSGYGSHRVYRNGRSTYSKGTEYGETTEYVFVGAYISKKFLFDSGSRKQMFQMKDETDIKADDLFRDIQEQVNDAEDDITNKSEVINIDTDETSESNQQTENVCNDDEIIQSDDKGEEEIYYDIDELRAEENKQKVMLGSKVRYKKLHTGEVIDTVIEEKKIIHNKLIDKCQGDIVIDGTKSYLIISVEN